MAGTSVRYTGIVAMLLTVILGFSASFGLVSGLVSGADVSSGSRETSAVRVDLADDMTGDAGCNVGTGPALDATDTARNITYRWYDMFNVPFEDWWYYRSWEQGGNEEILSNTYPYLYIWNGGGNNNWTYTSMRMNVTARNLPEINTTVNPYFFPLMNDATTGGNATLDMHVNFEDADDLREMYNDFVASWCDGWITACQGTLTMDRTAAMAVLDMTSAEFDDFDAWWAGNQVARSTEYHDWLYDQGNEVYDIYNAYEWTFQILFWDADQSFVAEKTDSETIVLSLDYATWGMEALYFRWLRDAFMNTEWYFENFTIHAEVGPERTDIDINTVVEYAVYAYETTLGGDPCWMWEALIQDVLPSTYLHQQSDYDPYEGKTYENLAPGSWLYGDMMYYDYVPGVQNLSAGEAMVIEWPDDPEFLFQDHIEPGLYENVTGPMIVDYSEPMWTDSGLEDQILLDLYDRTLTFVGPMDLWTWSRDQTAHANLANEWDRLGLLPYGMPTIEFSLVEYSTTPVAAFTVTPETAPLSTVFEVNASDSYDAEDPTSNLQVRWDWEGDGAWDTSLTTTKTASHQYSVAGVYDILLQVVDTSSLTDTASATVYVGGEPPTTSATIDGTTGLNGWFVSPVTVTLEAVDADSYVLDTMFNIDGDDWQDYVEPFTVDGDGWHTLSYYSVDDWDDTEPVKTAEFGIDTVAPETSYAVSGTEGNGGWYRSGSEIALTATDLNGVSGTSYRIDDGDWRAYAGGILVSEEGSHSVQFYSTDVAGNEETVKSIEVMVDLFGPLSELVISGSVNTQSWIEEVWHISDVSVEVSACDNASGVFSAKYSIDSGDWRSYLSPITVSTDGSHTVECYATDIAGNVGEIASVTVGIDRAAPVVTIIGFTTEDGVTSMNYVASDGTSGIHHLMISIDGGDAILVTGNPTSYEFESLGSGTHDVVLIGYDNAGNSAEISAEFEVPESRLLTSAQLYASIAIAAAVALAVALFFFMRTRKGKGSEEPGGE